MREHTCKISLEKQIIVLKEELNKLLNSEPMYSDKVLGISKKLDLLISEYYYHTLKNAS